MLRYKNLEGFIIIKFPKNTNNMNQLGQDIINLYKPYDNHHTNWKMVTIKEQKF